MPSIAFVVTKITKTIDIKLGKGGREALNASHSTQWVKTIAEITQYLVDKNPRKKYHFIDSTNNYQPLTDSHHPDLNALAEGATPITDDPTSDSSYNSGYSEPIDVQS